MANLHEETLALMPGRARSHWRLHEAFSQGGWTGRRPGKSQEKDLPIGAVVVDTDGTRYKVLKQYDTGDKLGSGAPDAGYIAMALPGSDLTLSGQLYHLPYVRVDKVEKKGSGDPAPKVRGTINFEQVEANKGWDPKQRKYVDPQPGQVALRDAESGQMVFFDANDFVWQGDPEIDPKTGEYGKAKVKRIRAKDVNPDEMVYDNARAAMRDLEAWLRQESVAGAPGPFAISDQGSVRDEVADLLDRVHSPRWEYPSWALPKEDLAEAAEDTEGRYSLVRRKGTVHAKGQNRDWWEVMYPTKGGSTARIATITQTADEEDPYEVEVGTLRPETLTQSFTSVGDAFRAAIKRWEKSHARG